MVEKNISTPAALFLHDKQIIDEMADGEVTMCLLTRTCVDEMLACISELESEAHRR